MSEHTSGGVHIASMRLLITIMIILMIGTYLTVSVTHYDFGFLNIWIGLGIATTKAILVGLYFMHLRWDKPFNAFVFISAFAFLFLFVGFALMDTAHYQDVIIPGWPLE